MKSLAASLIVGLPLVWVTAPCNAQISNTDYSVREDGGPTVQDTQELQAALRFLGYEIDPVNGIYGPQTTRAVEAFEFSVGMGDEGVLDEGERALLGAQVAALSYERFGYRLRGYWTPLPCDQDTDWILGLWFDDLIWIRDGQSRFSLIEKTLDEPLLISWENRQHSLSSSYFQAIDFGENLRFFPLENQILTLVNSQVIALNQCTDRLEKWSGTAAISPLMADLPH